MTVGPLDIKPFIKPSVLTDRKNGLIPSSLLTSIGPQGMLLRQVARGYNALAFKCLAIGLPLTYTLGGTYRTFEQQDKLFRQRYQLTRIAYEIKNGQQVYKTKVYLSQTWYQRPGTAEAAVPGNSNHGWACAIDFAFDSELGDGIGPDDAATITSHPQWPQFKKFLLECGFSWELTSEPWHGRWVAGDSMPQAVIDVENFIAAHQANQLPANPPVVVPAPDVTLPVKTTKIASRGDLPVFFVANSDKPTDPTRYICDGMTMRLPRSQAEADRLVKLGLAKNTLTTPEWMNSAEIRDYGFVNAGPVAAV